MGGIIIILHGVVTFVVFLETFIGFFNVEILSCNFDGIFEFFLR